ncbi:uncharacterized protein LOC135223295 [Macrobrachium nipponense]|uniref:uncharacterized protein LOC135223295 n=1 Tax=Macrobrachium nipponense TaxID=159736 RepID=UPI0030C8048E
MLAKEFYNEISDESKTLALLRRYGLLDEEQSVSPCHRCSGEMKDTRKRLRNGEFMPVLRCRNRGCPTFRSVRKGNAFFHFTDLINKVNCKLSLCQILELMFYFIEDLSYHQVQGLTGRGTEAICDWFNMCREVCTVIVSVQNRGQMMGTEEEPVQIDEARFAGRRKYNRGRMLQGDQAPNSTDSDAEMNNNRNHGRRIDGRRVFVLKKGSDCRYFYVQRRDRETLQQIIQREVAEDSIIHSDEWPAYSNLNHLNFRHFTGNHQQNYVDPNTGAHTQATERSWLDAKVRILKKNERLESKNLSISP